MTRRGDKGYTRRQSSEVVAHLEKHFGPPYRLMGFLPVGAAIETMKSTRADIQGQEFETLADVLKVFREEIAPQGLWLLFLYGKSDNPKFRKPGGFIDTGILEKALSWREEHGEAEKA